MLVHLLYCMPNHAVAGRIGLFLRLSSPASAAPQFWLQTMRRRPRLRAPVSPQFFWSILFEKLRGVRTAFPNKLQQEIAKWPVVLEAFPIIWFKMRMRVMRRPAISYCRYTSSLSPSSSSSSSSITFCAQIKWASARPDALVACKSATIPACKTWPSCPKICGDPSPWCCIFRGERPYSPGCQETLNKLQLSNKSFLIIFFISWRCQRR